MQIIVFLIICFCCTLLLNLFIIFKSRAVDHHKRISSEGKIKFFYITILPNAISLLVYIVFCPIFLIFVSLVSGVIVAIVVAAVFVLLAFIRVMIYCCSSSDSE